MRSLLRLRGEGWGEGASTTKTPKRTELSPAPWGSVSCCDAEFIDAGGATRCPDESELPNLKNSNARGMLIP